ncbi:MAG: hypothetical protein VB021_09380 [Oscillospiraceae bacterium]|nr:hypothetical protein [Oscillospiraceae bacterium]
MNNLGILIKNNFRVFIGSLKYSKRKRRFAASGLLFAVLSVYIVAVMALSAVSQTKMFLDYGKPEYALFYSVVYTLLLMLLTAIMRGVTPTRTSDADMLLSMPLTRREILLSKSVSRYLFELIPVTAFFLPSVVVYFIMVDRSAGMLLRGLVAYLLFPLLSVGVSYILSFLMFKVSDKFERPQVVSSVLSIVILLLFMYFNFGISGGLGGDLGALTAKFDRILPAAWGAFFIARGGAGYLLPLLCMTVAPFLLGNALFASIYGVRQSMWRSKDKTLHVSAHSPVGAIFRKEAVRYFGSSIYLVNTIIGPIFSVALTLFLIFGRGSSFYTEVFGAPEVAPVLGLILTATYCFMPGMTCITASSVSLEGRNLWVLRSSPLSEKDIFGAKILFHLAMSTPVTLLCGIVAALVAAGLTGGERAALVLLPTLLSVLAAISGLYLNLLFPKLEWDDEAAVVKQSAASGLSVLAGMLMTALPVAVYFLLGGALASGAKLLAAGGVFALLIVLFWVLLMTDGKKRFRELC